APHLTEWRGLYRGRTPLLLKPATTEEVARAVEICNRHLTPIAVQGGNTGLVGGGVPDDTGAEILLSLKRLNRIRVIDAADFSLVAEAGCTVAEVQDAARAADRLFPLSLASEGSCTIGGVISTNAGGINVLRYGSMRQLVLGIEAVLPTGEIHEGLTSLRKDNTGYDLKQLLIGAEGTLGIVTAAVLKLYPLPRESVTALVALPDPAAAIALFSFMREMTGDALTAFELMPRLGLDLVLRHIPGTRDPLPTPAPWYVLMEGTSSMRTSGLSTAFDAGMEQALERGTITDGVVAQSTEQAASLWKLRESLSEAQKLEGASIKHDVSVPIARIPEFIERASAAVLHLIPHARPVPFGHLGDGNLHFNIQAGPQTDGKAFLARWAEVNRVVHDVTAAFGGSISAEHGIGRLKRDELAHYKSPVALDLMRRIKAALDPNGILNRGRIL
ncbi:MAG TPA: FAD-binding oxidoreductase, partial [Sphingomonadales bacterium]